MQLAQRFEQLPDAGFLVIGRPGSFDEELNPKAAGAEPDFIGVLEHRAADRPPVDPRAAGAGLILQDVGFAVADDQRVARRDVARMFVTLTTLSLSVSQDQSGGDLASERKDILVDEDRLFE